MKAAARSVLSYPVTDEQAEAIATDEDVTLVLAGAGTGKTATIVGKVAHLVRNEGVQPAEISGAGLQPQGRQGNTGASSP